MVKITLKTTDEAIDLNPPCNIKHDRDYNAALNIKNYTVGTTEINAYGDMSTH